MNTLIKEADKFAEYHHGVIGQVRKYTGKPYIVHPRAVAKTVRDIYGTDEMIAAALLHDTVEDTDATIEHILQEFGPLVCSYVAGLTDVAKPEDGNRATRMRINNLHTGAQCAEVKTIKLADILDNTLSIFKYDRKFAMVYFDEKRDLLPFLVEGNDILFNKLRYRLYN